MLARRNTYPDAGKYVSDRVYDGVRPVPSAVLSAARDAHDKAKKRGFRALLRAIIIKIGGPR